MNGSAGPHIKPAGPFFASLERRRPLPGALQQQVAVAQALAGTAQDQRRQRGYQVAGPGRGVLDDLNDRDALFAEARDLLLGHITTNGDAP